MDIIQSLGIDPKIVLAQSVSFLVLLVALRYFLYGPITDILRQRQAQIADNLAQADTEKQNAAALRQEYEGHLATIADERRAQIDQARKDGEAERQRILEQAQGEAREVHQRHQAQMTLEREQLRRELRGEMSDLAVLAAQKALRGQITPELQSAVADHVIGELEAMTRA